MPASVDGTLESELRGAGPCHHVRGSGSDGMIAAGAAVRLGRGGAGDAPYDPAPVDLLDARRVPGSERPGSAQVLAGTPGHDRDDTAPDPGDLPADAKRQYRTFGLSRSAPVVGPSRSTVILPGYAERVTVWLRRAQQALLERG